MKEFLPRQDREYLMRRIGDISQICGAKRYILSDGRAHGVEAVDLKTGGGFDFTVLPGRGMDIAWAQFRGVPVGYISKTGIVGPSYYEPDGMGWLRSFFGGLLTTCGLSNVGPPCTDSDPVVGEVRHGLHGRISHTAARNVCVEQEWSDTGLIMCVSGNLRETSFHGENLLLSRKVTTRMGDKSLRVEDTVTNEGFVPTPLTILYHINIGYPVLDEGSRLVCATKSIKPNDDHSRLHAGTFNLMQAPSPGERERLYFVDLNAEPDGHAGVALVNDKLELGVYLDLDGTNLPCFTVWQQFAEAEYVVGLEPGNCIPLGRTELRDRGLLPSLDPGQQAVFSIEIGVLSGYGEIAAYERKVSELS